MQHTPGSSEGAFLTNCPRQQCFWATIPIYNTALILSKLSVLLQYLRIFPTKRMRIVCYCMIAFISIYGTWTILSAWLNCIPVSKFWDKNVDGYCLSKKGLWFSNSAIHILTDIMIIIYPMPALKSLQLPRRQKIAVMCIFSLGGWYASPVKSPSVCQITDLPALASSS